MNAETAKKVADWLNSLPTDLNGLYYENAVPVLVAIGKQQWFGARYDRVNTQPKLDRADWLYLLGPLPKAYERRSHLAFQAEQTQDKDWYVAGYNRKASAEDAGVDVAKALPFGDFFMMAVWQVPDGSKIDRHERSPYQRLKMTIQNL